MPAGLAPSPRCGGLDKLDQPVVQQVPWLRRAGAGTRPPLIELVEMPAGLAPSPRCGGLDKLDQPVVEQVPWLRCRPTRWLRTAPVADGIAPRLEEALRPFLKGDLPVRLKAWDGSVAGPLDAPLVVLRSPDAVRRMLRHPGELGAA